MRTAISFEQLQAEVPELKRVACSALCKWGYSEKDAVAEGLYKLWVWSTRPSQPNAEGIEAYLYRSLHNAEKDKIKRIEYSFTHVEAIDECNLIAPESYSPHRLMDMIKGMRDDWRHVVLLTFHAGYDQKEVAALLNTTTGAVKQRLFKAKQFLRKREVRC